MAKETKRAEQPEMANDSVTKKKSDGGGARDIDEDAGEQGAGHDGDAKKKETKGFTARNNNDDDSKDKNPDTKGGKKTNDPEFKKAGAKGVETQKSGGGSNQDSPKSNKQDKNDNKKSGTDSPKKKSSEKKST